MKTIVLPIACLALLAHCGGTTSEPGPTDDVSTDIATPDMTVPPVEACPVLDESLGETPLDSHQVQWAHSSDGVTFTTNDQVLLEKASVPDAVMGPNGKVWVYFVNGNPGQHAIFVAEQQNDGTLETFDCIRIDGAVRPNAVDPDVVRLPDGRYRLFFFEGWFVGDAKPQNVHPFYSAISDDGIHFTQEVKILETTGGGTDPTATFLDDGTWLLGVTMGDEVVLAKGTDGGVFWPTGVTFPGGIPEIASFDDGAIRMYVSGKDGKLIHKSTDGGETWEEEGTFNIPGADPSLVKLDDHYYALFYKSFSGAGPGPGPGPGPDAHVSPCKDANLAPTEALYVEVTWATPGDKDQRDEGPEAGSDVDLHLVHPLGFENDSVGWFDQPFDCFWFNQNPNWGDLAPAAVDDPNQIIDDTDGCGPEAIIIEQPEADTWYSVGVHYWNTAQMGPSHATVRVWFGGKLVLEAGPVMMKYQDLWTVGRVCPTCDAVDEEQNEDGSPKVEEFIPDLLTTS
jgi:hypothetical protein